MQNMKRKAKAQKKWWRNNSEKTQGYRKNKKLKREVWFEEIKKELKCEVCGENHPACITFHHRNPDEKYMDVSVLVQRGYSEEKILQEIAKCDVLCPNCHKKRHWELGKHLTEEERRRRDKRYKELSRRGRGAYNIKKYVCTDPCGVEHTTTNGLTQFCRGKALCVSGFMRVLRGAATTYKGWTIRRIETKQYSLKIEE